MEAATRRLQSLQVHLSSLDDDSQSNGTLEHVNTSASSKESEKKNQNTITIIDNRTGKTVSIPVEGDVVRATDLKKLNLRTYDPGYMNTASAISRITWIDGDNGILYYRGYPIEELAEKSTFLEVAYLLINGDLPSKPQLDQWSRKIMSHTYIHENLVELMKTFRYDAHPMGMLISTMSALSTFYPEQNPNLSGQDIFKKADIRNKQVYRIIGKLPTIAACAYRHRIGRPYNQPSNYLGYTDNFLYMMDHLGDEGTSSSSTTTEGSSSSSSSSSSSGYKPHPILSKALDVLFILHADHEMNCSTAAMRHISSSGADPYTSVAAASGALFGPLHGGANESVLRMLESIGSVDNVTNFINDVKLKKKKLMGFGHRIYKNYDPRAKIIRKIAYQVFDVLGKEPLIEVATELEKRALEDEYFISRKLYPNVDFYSGLIYKAMGFPYDYFPVLFTIPRAVGWLAHWLELMSDQDNKIARPMQVYKGEPLRHYIPIDKRDKDADFPTKDTYSTTYNKRRAVSTNH